MIRDIYHAIGKRSATQQNYSEANFMKTTLIGIAAIAALSLFGLCAHASCSDPRVESQQPIPMILNHGHLGPHEGIVGTWLVTYPHGQAYIQWHSDGTEWENISYPVLGGNICMGSWEALDRWHFSRNHYGWIFTDGAVTGYFNETETDTLSNDGNSYTGNNVTIFYDMAGTVVPAPGQTSSPPAGGYPGTSSAVRIAP